MNTRSSVKDYLPSIQEYLKIVIESEYNPFTKEEILAVMKDSKERIQDPKHWTQGAEARKIDGTRCDANNQEAYSFCAVGSMNASPLNRTEIIVSQTFRNYPRDIASYVEAILLEIVDRLDWNDTAYTLRKLNYFNDDNASHKDLMRVFDMGIKELENYG